MIIHLATDHAGLDLKNSIKTYLLNKGFEVKDHGAHELIRKMITQILFFHVQKLLQKILIVGE